jgi:PadR family transcriptional regulator, regulatory protein PadR
VEHIGMSTPRLGDFEYLVLLALLRIGADAYGAVVRREIERHAGRQLGISAVYTTLERLEQKRLVRSAEDGGGSISSCNRSARVR